MFADFQQSDGRGAFGRSPYVCSPGLTTCTYRVWPTFHGSLTGSCTSWAVCRALVCQLTIHQAFPCCCRYPHYPHAPQHSQSHCDWGWWHTCSLFGWVQSIVDSKKPQRKYLAAVALRGVIGWKILRFVFVYPMYLYRITMSKIPRPRSVITLRWALDSAETIPVTIRDRRKATIRLGLPCMVRGFLCEMAILVESASELCRVL